MATTPMPSAVKSFASRMRRSRTAFTYGQWLQMNITSRPLGPRLLFKVQVLPSTPGREKAGAGWPKSQTGVSFKAMVRAPENGGSLYEDVREALIYLCRVRSTHRHLLT